VDVADIVVLGDHQGIGGMGPGRTQHPLLPVAALEQGHPERPRARGEFLARSAGDHHDLLAEAAKLHRRNPVTQPTRVHSVGDRHPPSGSW
jgi:hypothetical protein